MVKEYDYIILGAGIYGFYSADILSKKKTNKIAILEYDKNAFQRASYINQARIHNGYHYPRSYSTAKKTAYYFEKFNKDFSFAVNNKFKKIYAISSKLSLTTAEQFLTFCHNAGIKCNQISYRPYFREGLVSGVFDTTEYAFDSIKIKNFFLEKFKNLPNVDIYYNTKIKNVENRGGKYILKTNEHNFHSPFVLNCTYASINQVLERFHFQNFKIKYEICEIIFCKTSSNISNIGITVMDGPFFSIMPFGLTAYHSLTSVMFTPHLTSFSSLPQFSCQKINEDCSPHSLENCNDCIAKPKSAYIYMKQLAKKYLRTEISYSYDKSLFAIKPILKSSELDDSRPTVIKLFSRNPTFISVLSGKINTIYDLNEVLL